MDQKPGVLPEDFNNRLILFSGYHFLCPCPKGKHIRIAQTAAGIQNLIIGLYHQCGFQFSINERINVLGPVHLDPVDFKDGSRICRDQLIITICPDFNGSQALLVKNKRALSRINAVALQMPTIDLIICM